MRCGLLLIGPSLFLVIALSFLPVVRKLSYTSSAQVVLLGQSGVIPTLTKSRNPSPQAIGLGMIFQ